MAEGFLCAKGIIEKAGDLSVQEIGLLWGIKDELQKLSETVSTISAVLLDAEEKKLSNQVKQWLQRLNVAIYDADNLLDDISTEALRQEEMTRNKEILCIEDCPTLLERCKRETGADWRKIAHIPFLLRDRQGRTLDEEPNEAQKKPTHRNWSLIRTFWCCKC